MKKIKISYQYCTSDNKARTLKLRFKPMDLTQAADQVLYLQCLRLCKDLKASNDGQVTFPSTVFEAMGMEVLDHLYVGRKPKILRPYITNTEELVNINYKLFKAVICPIISKDITYITTKIQRHSKQAQKNMFCFLRMHPQWLLFRQYIARLFEMPELEFEQKKLQATKKLADYYHSLYG